MDGLDPCIGVGFLIRNADDLRSFEDAFSKHGRLNKIATIYKEKPKDLDLSRKLDDLDLSLAGAMDHSLL